MITVKERKKMINREQEEKREMINCEEEKGKDG